MGYKLVQSNQNKMPIPNLVWAFFISHSELPNVTFMRIPLAKMQVLTLVVAGA